MTREEAKAEINKVFEPAFANYIITALTECATPSDSKTGKWIDTADKLDREIGNRHDFVCPNCQRHASDFIAGIGDWWCYDAPEYCPNCGAKIEVDE